MSEKIRKPRKATPANPVPAPTPEAPAPVPAPKVALPVGPVRAPHPVSGKPFGFDWSNVTRWAALAEKASEEFGVPVSRLMAHVVIESQGEPDAIQKNEG